MQIDDNIKKIQGFSKPRTPWWQEEEQAPVVDTTPVESPEQPEPALKLEQPAQEQNQPEPQIEQRPVKIRAKTKIPYQRRDPNDKTVYVTLRMKKSILDKIKTAMKFNKALTKTNIIERSVIEWLENPH